MLGPFVFRFFGRGPAPAARGPPGDLPVRPMVNPSLCVRVSQEDIGFSALVQLFDPVLSPRCYAVVGVKRPCHSGTSCTVNHS